MIDVILPDNITYFGAIKKVFIEKLCHIFHQFKLCGIEGDLPLIQRDLLSDTYQLVIEELD
ncbi:MAG: hypothetical protein L0Y61_05925, partial [Epsilonproteobacteria bacterium]|nr:hypothetical protein [Campylobacterota bacterium]